MVQLLCPGSGSNVNWKYQTSAGSTDEDFIFTGSKPGPLYREKFVLDTANNRLIINDIAVNDSGLYHCIEHGTRHTFTVTVNLHCKSS